MPVRAEGAMRIRVIRFVRRVYPDPVRETDSKQRTVWEYFPAVLPLLVPVLLQVGYRFLVSVAMLGSPKLGPHSPWQLPLEQFDTLAVPSAVQVTGEASARLAWLATVVLLVGLCIGVWTMSCYWVLKCLKREPAERQSTERKGLPGIPLLVVAAVAGASVTLVTRETSVPLKGVQDYVVRRVFEHPKGPFTPLFGDAASLLGVLCGLLSVAGVTMALAACMTVHTHCDDRYDTRKLSESMRKLQHVLFAGALLLIAAVIEFRALFTWAAESTSETNVEVVTQVGATAAATLGAVYALALAAIYFPAALVLSARAREIAVDALALEKGVEKKYVSSPDVDGWLQNKGLVFSTPKALSTMAAVLSPLLAQVPVAALLDLLK